MQDKNLYKIIIWAYLHDIGKIFQRWWFWRSKDTNIVLDKWTIWDYQVAHAQFTRDYFFNIPTNDWCILSSFWTFKEIKFNKFWKEIWLIASLHHWRDFSSYKHELTEIQQKLAWIINIADNLSSSERQWEWDKEDDKKYINTTWLTTIFANIFEDDGANAYKYESKTLNSWFFCPSLLSEKVNFKETCENFLKQFSLLIWEYKNIDENTNNEMFELFISKLDILFQNFTTFIPSSAYKTKIVDISLYDHTKTTVAFATTMYKWYFQKWFENIKISRGKNKIEQETVLLIAGDFPSIQKYISWWIVKQTKLAKRLRAKSLRVQLLNEAIIQYLLEKLWLPRANVLINAGWKFVILSQNWVDVFEYLNDINRFLLEKFDWNIKFSLISKEFELWKIAWIWKEHKDIFADLFEDLSKNKFQCYDKNNLQTIFKQINIWWKKLCKYCWQNYLETEDESEYDENEENSKCDDCKQEEDLWWFIVKKNKHIFIDYKKTWNFYYEEKLEEKDGHNFESNNWQLKILFNNWSYEDLQDNIWISKSINLHVPIDEKENNVKGFSKLANDNWYLCMLKWDIDAMSLIFKRWFGDNYSISRLVQFSRFLELFFGKYLQDKIFDEYKDVYTVFSWWDDFVFIVPFDVRKQFVEFLYDEFQKFVWQNQYIHFSTWIWIFKHKTPFGQVDKYTEELLKSAKAKSKEWLQCKIDLVKYWICFYEKEFVKVYWKKQSWILNEKFKIDNLNLNRNLEWEKSSMLYKVYTTIKEMRQNLDREKPMRSDFILKWARLLYMLKRNIDDDKFEEIEKDLDFLKSIWWEWEKKDKIEKMNNLLLKLVDWVYEGR